MSAVLLNLGAIIGVWGIMWAAWDKHAIGSWLMIAVGIAALIVGGTTE